MGLHFQLNFYYLCSEYGQFTDCGSELQHMNKNRSFFFARFSQVTLNGEYVLISFMYNNIS